MKGIKIDRIDMLSSLEDLRVTLYWIAWVGQWKPEQKKAWDNQGITTYHH
jgi:hypothetical protein